SLYGWRRRSPPTPCVPTISPSSTRRLGEALTASSFMTLVARNGAANYCTRGLEARVVLHAGATQRHATVAICPRRSPKPPCDSSAMRRRSELYGWISPSDLAYR